MHKVLCFFLFLLSALLIFTNGAGQTARADEGMWTLNHFPTLQVSKKYGFKATKEWLDHVRLSSARLANGCSGSFVSKDGLVLTNHHCAHSCIEQISNASKNYVADGFYAKTLSDEVRCPEIEIDRLTDISDVTSRVNAATQGLRGKAFNHAQNVIKSRIEKACSHGSDEFRCEVVTLYHGGKYQLYKYQRYQDVRLVFAPEFAAAFFGGDPDNFMFPRYDLDVSFLRVYHHGKPLKTDDYFRWSTRSAKDGDLSFVIGNPGRTSRLLTVSQLEYQRDTYLLRSIFRLSELRGILTGFGERGSEEKRISENKLFGVENTLKAFKGRLGALLNKKFFAKKVAEEEALRGRVDANPKLRKAYGSAWSEIAQAETELKSDYAELSDLEFNHDFNSRLYGIAKTLIRASVELPKPSGKRLREFADSRIPNIKQDLFSPAPIHDELEIEMLKFNLTKLREDLGADNPIVKRILGDRSPSEIARSVVQRTTLQDISVRKALFDGGLKAILASKDPMIRFALLVDPDARAIRKKFDTRIEPVIDKNAERIAKARFAVYGSKTYPDATFTLRISYGQIKGYRDNDHFVKPFTTLEGAFKHNTGEDPFALPQSWIQAKSKLALSTPLDFCTTNDIIGGNSGSPVINRDAELIGVIFDGNIQSLGGEFGYDGSTNRAIAVDSAAITELLRKVYGADRIVNELAGKSEHLIH